MLRTQAGVRILRVGGSLPAGLRRNAAPPFNTPAHSVLLLVAIRRADLRATPGLQAKPPQIPWGVPGVETGWHARVNTVVCR